MLVLSRKKAEQIQIGDNITITVLKVKGAAVQIGIDAPGHVKILRSELSFDPPAVAEAPTPVATGATKVPPATRNGQPIERRRSIEHVDHSTTARCSTIAAAVDRNPERVTLADTLVFLG
jgi:carbon storage regulator